MNKIILITLLLSFIEVPLLFSQSRPAATLEITFTGIRSDKGQITIGINESPEGWPRKPDMDPNWKKSGIKDGSMTVKIEGLTYGTYAVSLLDDENSDLKMNTFLGVPKEGYGFSNNIKIKMSAPDFEDCAFIIDKPHTKITICIQYFGKGES